MTQAKIKPGQSKRPIDLKDTRQVNKKNSKNGSGFELSTKGASSKSKESRNDQ